MECWQAKQRILCNHVIMLWNDKNGDPAALHKIQLSSPFFYFFPGGHIRNTPDCPGHNHHNNLHFAPFLFDMASSLVLFVLRHGVETSNLADAECCLLALFLHFHAEIKHII